MTSLRRSDHEDLNVGYHAEFSMQLGEWREGVVTSVTPLEDFWEQVTMEPADGDEAIGDARQLYARLRVVFSESGP